ncbi:MAG: hypothetical protein DHS20C06_17790 [Hyphobacterium sp.]|nr:MAG: hypothetical protein DHS20C06_17790 [Hyphobacterium sp.]
MAKDPSRWLVGVLPQHREVTNVNQIGKGVVVVDRKDAPEALVGIIANDSIWELDCEALASSSKPQPDFIVSMKNTARWQGEAIDYLESKQIAWGKMYDLYRGLNYEKDLSAYRNPSLCFARRLLEQHQNVCAVEWVSDLAFRLLRLRGDAIIVALSDAYELTADAVRVAYHDLAPFDVLMKNTPYGSISSKGAAAAKELGVEICDQSSIYQVLATP